MFKKAVRVLPPILLLPVVLVAGTTVTGAHGDWPQSRATPAHTAFQALPAKISNPLATPVYHLGGVLRPDQTLVAPPSGPCSDGVLIVASAGVLEARCTSGQRIWSHRYVTNASLWTLVDLDDDGTSEFLVSSVRNGICRLDVVDVGSGALRFTTQAETTGRGTIAIGDVDGDGGTDLVWCPAGASIVDAYSFQNGYDHAVRIWRTYFQKYVSDPYSPSPIVIGDSTPGRGAEVAISGGRHEFDIALLDGLTGVVTAQKQYLADPTAIRVTEGGGDRQGVAFRDVHGDGSPEIVVVGGYPSSASYMFQGAIVTPADGLSGLNVYDAHPFGWEFVQGSIREAEEDRPAELVVSIFNPAQRQYITELIDLNTLSAVGAIADARLQAIIETSSGPVAIVQTGNKDESIRPDLPLRAYQFDGTSFTTLGWQIPLGQVMTTRNEGIGRNGLANGGAEAVTADWNQDGQKEFLLKTANNVVVAVNLYTGRQVSTFQTDNPIDFLKPLPSKNGFVAEIQGGTVVTLDASMSVIAKFDAGGFYRPSTSNGHFADAAIVADLDGDGRNELYATDALARLVRLNVRTRDAEIVWPGGMAQEPIAAGGSFIFRSCEIAFPNAVCQWSPGGELVSQTILPTDQTSPIGLNIGRFGPQAERGVVVASTPQYPMTTYAVTLDGRVLWHAAHGPYWDATYAVADFDHDGVDDVVYNYNSEKAWILSGVDGHVLADAVTLPIYRQLNYVDYNGAPVIVDADADGSLEVVDTEDDGHVALIRPVLDGPDPHSEIVWAVEQAVLDDERAQMPAAAPVGDKVVLGCGSNRGVFAARDAATGATLWQRTLTADTSVPGTSLTKSIALDVNDDGVVDFVVGGDDGQLRALDGKTGQQLWSVDIGMPLGDPIAADIDGDGFSEIIVAAADGWLYVVNDNVRRRAVPH